MPASVWDSPSLCDGWRVREVVAHVTMAARNSPDQFMAELATFLSDFTALSNGIAHRDGGAPTDAWIADLRSETTHRVDAARWCCAVALARCRWPQATVDGQLDHVECEWPPKSAHWRPPDPS